MVHSARVRVNLPDRGLCWFFITPEDRVEDFATALKTEDNLVVSLEVMTGNNKA